jgi:hypothetical protein
LRPDRCKDESAHPDSFGKDGDWVELFETASAKYLQRSFDVDVAWDESELTARLDRIKEITAMPTSLGEHASPELIQALRDFIDLPEDTTLSPTHRSKVSQTRKDA